MGKFAIFHDLPDMMSTRQVIDRLRELAACENENPDKCAGKEIHQTAAELADSFEEWDTEARELQAEGAVYAPSYMVERKEELHRRLVDLDREFVFHGILAMVTDAVSDLPVQ